MTLVPRLNLALGAIAALAIGTELIGGGISFGYVLFDKPDTVVLTPAVQELPAPPPAAGANALASLRERPLFTPSRRPPAPPAPLEAPPPAPVAGDLSGVRLTAVFIDGTVATAILETQGSERLRLHLGDEFRGWHVAKIEAALITLEAGGTTQSLTLVSPSAPPSSAMDAGSQGG